MTKTIKMTKRLAKAIVLQAAENIEAEEGRLDLDHWGLSNEGLYTDWVDQMVPPTCNTPACIAGHIAWACPDDVAEAGGTVPFAAREVLLALSVFRGIDLPPWDLFGASSLCWPEHYWPTGGETTAQAAVRMLRDIASGEILELYPELKVSK